MLTFFSFWWLALYWTYSSAFPRPFDDWKNGLFYIGSGLFFVAVLLKRKGAFTVSKNPLVLVALFYVVWAFASIFLGNAYYEGLLAWGRLFLWSACIWVLMQIDSRALTRIMQLGVMSAALIAILAFCQLSAYISLYPYSYFVAPVGYKSYFGDFMALHVPLAFYLIFSSSKKWLRVLWGTSLFLIFMGLWISGSRASILGTVAGFVVGLFLAIRYLQVSKKWVFGLMASVLIAGFFINQLQSQSYDLSPTVDRLASLIGVAHDEDVSNGRFIIYKNTLRMIRERPVTGWGLGEFRFVYPKFSSSEDTYDFSKFWMMHPHNELLNQAAELGVIGLLIFLSIVFLILREGLKNLAKDVSYQDKLFLVVGMAGIVTALVSWQFSTTFLNPLVRLLVSLYLAILLRSSKIRFSK